MPGESYRRCLRSLLLCLCDVFRELINSLCSLIVHKWSGPRSVSDYISSVGTLCPSCRLVVSSSQTCLVDDFPLINDNVWIWHVANSGLIKFSQCFGPTAQYRDYIDFLLRL